MTSATAASSSPNVATRDGTRTASAGTERSGAGAATPPSDLPARTYAPANDVPAITAASTTRRQFSRSARITTPRSYEKNPVRYRCGMCRSIKVLRDGAEPATDDEIRAAALQYVRKVSGYRQPSRANEAAFTAAVADITDASRRLLEAVAATHPGARRA